MTRKDTPPIPAHLRYLSTDDGAILLNIHKGTMFSMNPTASSMFESIIEGRDQQRIVLEISTTFNVPPDRVATDLQGLVQDLKLKGLLP